MENISPKIVVDIVNKKILQKRRFLVSLCCHVYSFSTSFNCNCLFILDNELNFVFNPEAYNEIMNKSTYDKHPCKRECRDNSSMVCKYTFLVYFFLTNHLISLQLNIKF